MAMTADFRIDEEPLKLTAAIISLGAAALIRTLFMDVPYLAIVLTGANVKLLQLVFKASRVESRRAAYWL